MILFFVLASVFFFFFLYVIFRLIVHVQTGSAAGMESLEKVWNLFFQFPDLEKVWKFVKSFGNFKKRFGTFCLLPEKNFQDRKCASRSSARKLLPRV